MVKLTLCVSEVVWVGGNGRELLHSSVVCPVSHLAKLFVTFVLCHIQKLLQDVHLTSISGEGCFLNCASLLFFLQDDVSSPGDLVIADGGKSLKLQI